MKTRRIAEVFLVGILFFGCAPGVDYENDPSSLQDFGDPGPGFEPATHDGAAAAAADSGRQPGDGDPEPRLGDPGGNLGDGDAPPLPLPCGVDDVGACAHVALCGEGHGAIEGLCNDAIQIQCCAPDVTPCSVAGVPGFCMDTLDCGDGWSPTAGHCPGPANIQCCTEDGRVNDCDPDAAPLPNADLLEEPGEGGCPAGMVAVESFCIDRFEASLVLEADDGSLIGGWSPYVTPGSERVRAVSLPFAVPQGHISGQQAAAACARAHKRLCTAEEWLRACRGADESIYPYGSTPEPGLCNDARLHHPAVEYFGTSASWIWSELGNPCIGQLPDGLDLTGENSGCVTAEGVFDLMGNVHEWTAEDSGVFRGGFYVDTAINGEGCLYATTAHNTQHWDYSTGFRCCEDL